MLSREELRNALRQQVLRAIEREEQVCFDVCAEMGQMFDNIKHTTMFKKEVARWFLYNSKKYEPLQKKASG